MRRILLTGSSGYLGGELKNFLESRNHETWIGRHDSITSRIRFTQKSVMLSNIEEEMEDLQINFTDLVLCGTPNLPNSDADLLQYFDEAVLLPYQWVSKLANRGLKRVIFIGSYWQEPEGNGFLPSNVYSLAKQSLQYLLSVFSNLEIRVDIVHLGDLYGPNDHRTKLIPEVIRKITKLEKVLVEHPNYIMRPVYLSDVLCGLESLLLEENDMSDNLAIHSMLGPEKLRVEEVVGKIFEVFGADKKLIVTSRDSSTSPYSGQSQYSFPVKDYEFINLEYGINSLKNCLKE